jgi:hypothetical protein
VSQSAGRAVDRLADPEVGAAPADVLDGVDVGVGRIREIGKLNGVVPVARAYALATAAAAAGNPSSPELPGSPEGGITITSVSSGLSAIRANR